MLAVAGGPRRRPTPKASAQLYHVLLFAAHRQVLLQHTTLVQGQAVRRLLSVGLAGNIPAEEFSVFFAAVQAIFAVAGLQRYAVPARQ